MSADEDRQIEKIELALTQALTYFTKTSEANAATHGSERVLYSPIVTTLSEALTALETLKPPVEVQVQWPRSSSSHWVTPDPSAERPLINE